ncbi:hypothetical protein MPTK1_4g09800 [Marchantia polymorpha subsp. ruderalis]|uniref:Uncharacterized protein n=2 Tax=Marchantia polymorpha TaxID=3197 RepID=A0AAF6B884_MARPO|nr:hypothetical protein MARPO_0132s0023 [Marchantia polymorpha]BBN08218.1 hypothetical protein Mp_4g09800 [Marchantia polymorpha subsp. ruderalis]|eukprot:PTQ29948.1 hypothetical protein MARPO_0132s0023 [Marchantia polymorpha]
MEGREMQAVQKERARDLACMRSTLHCCPFDGPPPKGKGNATRHDRASDSASSNRSFSSIGKKNSRSESENFFFPCVLEPDRRLRLNRSSGSNPPAACTEDRADGASFDSRLGNQHKYDRCP